MKSGTVKHPTSNSAVDSMYYKAGENYAKFAAFVWVVYGIYAIFAGKLEGNFVSLLIFISLYFTFGSAFAAFASFLPYLPMYGLNRLCDKAGNAVLSFVAILVNYLSWIVVIFWIIFLANWIIGINNHLFSPTSSQIQNAVIPAEYKRDREALVDSIIALNEAHKMNQEQKQGQEMYSKMETAIGLSRQVNDNFLDYVHPELKHMYRNKLIKGAELWLEGVNEGDTKKQIEGSSLDAEWLDWFNSHQDDFEGKVF